MADRPRRIASTKRPGEIVKAPVRKTKEQAQADRDEKARIVQEKNLAQRKAKNDQIKKTAHLEDSVRRQDIVLQANAIRLDLDPEIVTAVQNKVKELEAQKARESSTGPSCGSASVEQTEVDDSAKIPADSNEDVVDNVAAEYDDDEEEEDEDEFDPDTVETNGDDGDDAAAMDVDEEPAVIVKTKGRKDSKGKAKVKAKPVINNDVQTIETPAKKARKVRPARGEFRNLVADESELPAIGSALESVAAPIKRKAPPVPPTNAKRNKMTPAVGLIQGWEKRFPGTAAVKPQPVAKNVEAVVPSEFDDAETDASATAALNAKATSVKLVKPAVAGSTVLFTKGSVLKIEDGITVTRKAAKARYDQSHLPFNVDTAVDDLKRWKGTYMPSIIATASNVEDNIFSSHSICTRQLVLDLWNDVYDENPLTSASQHNGVPVTDILVYVSISGLTDYRSHIGKKAISSVQAALTAMENPTDPDDFVSRDDYLSYAMPESFWLYANPTGPQGKKGLFCSPIVLRMLNLHEEKIKGSIRHFGFPKGALALCVTALERAFLFAQEFDIDDAESVKTDVTQFGATSWKGQAKYYATNIRLLTDEDLARIARMQITDASILQKRSEKEIQQSPSRRRPLMT